MARECRQNYTWYSHKHQMNSERRGHSFQVQPRQEEVTLHFPGLHFQTSQKETHAGRCWPIKVKQTHALLWFIIALDTHLPILEAAFKHSELSPEPSVPYVQAFLHSPGVLRRGAAQESVRAVWFPPPHSPHPLRPPPKQWSQKIPLHHLQPQLSIPWQFEKNSSVLSPNAFCSDVPVWKYCPPRAFTS